MEMIMQKSLEKETLADPHDMRQFRQVFNENRS